MSWKRASAAGESGSSAPDFDVIPLRYRRDGWTPERQVAFIRALAECGCPRAACKAVGMSLASAYRLYRRAAAAGFRRAWNAAMAAAAPPRRPTPSMKTPVRPAPVPGLSPEGSARLAGRLRDAIAGSWQASTSSTYSTSAEGPGSRDPLAGPFVRVRRTIRLRIPAGDLARPLVSGPPAPIEGRQRQRGRRCADCS